MGYVLEMFQLHGKTLQFKLYKLQRKPRKFGPGLIGTWSGPD